MSQSESLPSDPVTTQHVRWSEVPVETISPLFERQLVTGEKTMIARILLKKGCVVPLHQHFNEQISFIESGALQFVVSGQEILLRAGEVLCIPPNAPHTATALEDTVDIDVFNPPREDWLNKTDEYLRR